MEAIEALNTRATAKTYGDTAPTKEHLAIALQAAVRAPDHGLEEFGEGTGDKGEPQLVARCLFPEFGHMQEALEKRGVHPLSATHEYIATTPVELPEAQATEVLQMIDALEQNDDVQNVYHSLV